MTFVLLLAALLAPAQAAPPLLVPQQQLGVTLDAPADWKLLVKPDVSNVTISHGLATTITLYWYPYKPGVTSKIMLDVLMKTVRQHLPLGELTETGRGAFPGLDRHGLRRGERMQADVTVGAMGFGITMNLGFVTLIDQPNDRVLAAILLAPPEVFEDLDGMHVLTEVVSSLRLDRDAKEPTPGWWWFGRVPKHLAPPVLEASAQ